MKALELTNVGLVLGSGVGRTQALTDINLTVSPGELVAVTGRSGSGKSSLCNVSGGLASATMGEISVFSEPLVGNEAKVAEIRRRFVGYIFQDYNLIGSLTALENVSLPLELGGTPVAEARAQATSALEQVELGFALKRSIGELSGGEQQRVAIARGLVGERKLFLADEPTAALDDVTGEHILRLLRSKCDEGAAALMVTHDPAQAAWADRVIRLSEGRLVGESQAASESIELKGLH